MSLLTAKISERSDILVIFISIAVTAAVLFILFLIFAFCVFRKYFSGVKNPLKAEKKIIKKLRQADGENLAEQYEKNRQKFNENGGKEVTIFSRDELHLSGRLFLAENGSSDKSVILFHSENSCAAFDFSAEFKMYREMNYNILLPDQRAHAGSEGRYSTMGIMESYDLVNWCKWLEMCFGTENKITIHGISMGAFAAVAAAANSEMPKNVKCIIADSVYPLIRDFIGEKSKSELMFFAKPVSAFLNVFYKNHTGFDMRDFSLYTVAKSVKIPVLFIHPEKDKFSPLVNIESLVKRIPVKSELVTIKKAPHATCFVRDEKLCTEEIKKFIGEA